MARTKLIPFWIIPPDTPGPVGFGATGYSLDDALRIIRDLGYDLPMDVRLLRITEGVTVAELDQNHVVPNMGPIVVRGMWYPLLRIGA